MTAIETCDVLEASTPELDDVVRLEDRYGRVGRETMTKPRALITGVTGQDGSYLAELLLEKGYQVFGMVRRASTENFARIEHLRHDIELVQADLLDQLSLITLLQRLQPA